MYAIIKSGSLQYKVSEGDSVRMELLEGQKPGAQVEFDKVLLLSKDTGATIGAPFVAGAKVVGEVVKELKGKKTVGVRFRRRKGLAVKRGHRQRYMDVKIKQIVAP